MIISQHEDHYQIDTKIIPHPILFVLLSFAVALFGALILMRSIANFEIRTASGISRQIADLKAKAEKIILQYDNCEFKGNDYQEEIQDESRKRGLDVLFNQTGEAGVVEVPQSALIYCHRSGERMEWFKSQTFPIGEVSLKMRVMKGDLV